MIMKRFSFFVLAVLLTGCSGTPKSENEFVIKVDSIVCADTVNVGEKIPVRFYGDIGADTNCAFSRFNIKSDTLLTEITVIGKHEEKKNKGCDTLRLDGKELILPSSQYDSVCLVVRNPGLARVLRKTIIVRK